MNKTNKWIAIIVVVIVIAGAISFVGYNYYDKPRAKGQEITINSSQSNISAVKATRIVSLDPAATATLYALGAYKDMVGSCTYATYPTNDLPNVSAFENMNVEEIYNLSANTVISFSNYQQSQINQLTEEGINYVFLSSGANSTFKDIERQNTLLGEITGTQKNATKLNEWMNESLQDFKNLNVTSKSFLYAMCVCTGGKTETAGNSTFDNSIFSYAHLNNIANQTGYYQISRETIVNSNPQVILLGQYFNVSDLKQEPYVSTSAYKNKTIYNITTSTLNDIFDQPNFRDIFAIEWLIDQVYGMKVSIPAFPMDLAQNPAPSYN